MKYGLGIDTGGTYTDAVIFDFKNERIIGTAKSITIKEDLTIGINGAIEQLPQDVLGKVKLVALSTTLATNACVEGKGNRAKLVLIGFNEEVLIRYGKEYGLPDPEDIIFLDGGHNQEGNIKSVPDWDMLKAKAVECRSITDTFAVVEIWGTRNADFEKKAKEIIVESTAMQVVCGYELNDEPNSLKRAASALLNAQLIYTINDFLNAVKASMRQKGIDAPLVIVRGDGSLMSEAFAREKPVETLLCGPAASVAGGMKLAGVKNCIVVDMGGTTSDIAIVKDGSPKLASTGANIGKWKTGIKSIFINTVGLGGDSLIRHNNENKLVIGPVRAAPLSWAACRWPVILDNIAALNDARKRHTVSLCEFFYLIRDISEDTFYSENERNISKALKNGPLSITALAEAAGTSVYDINTKRLEQYGIIMRCGLTPTDLMHLTGAFTGWNKDAAYFGAMIMAHQLDLSLNELMDSVNEIVKERLFHNIISALMEDKDEKMLKGGVSKQLDRLLTASFREKYRGLMNKASGNRTSENKTLNDSFLGCNFTTDATLVGIGAPIHIYLPDVARVLDTDCIVPENAGVANAIGAITGNVMAEESVLVKPQYSVAGIMGYTGFTPSGNRMFEKHTDAVEWAKAKAYEMVREAALKRGADDIEIKVEVYNHEADISNVYKEDAQSGVGESREGSQNSLGEAGDEVRIGAGEIRDLNGITTVSDITDDADEYRRGGLLLLETIVTARAAGKVKWN